MGKPIGNLTLDQKRVLGLYFKCDDKWHQGNKCQLKALHTIEDDEEEHTDPN